eukprot:603687-Rhodomonas_salina.1
MQTWYKREVEKLVFLLPTLPGKTGNWTCAYTLYGTGLRANPQLRRPPPEGCPWAAPENRDRPAMAESSRRRSRWRAPDGRRG